MKLRRLTEGEQALAETVFGKALHTGPLRLVTGAPTGGWAMVIWRVMLFPVECEDFSLEPVERRAWFVHELTHAWQFQTGPIRTVLSWAKTLLSGGYIGARGYAYPVPPVWNELNLEQQARVVEHSFLVRSGFAPAELAPGSVLALARLQLPWECEAA